MRLLLVNPWITDYAAFDLWARPLGLLYLGAALRERGHEVRLVDCLDRFQPGSEAPAGLPNGTGKFHRVPLAAPAPLPPLPRRFGRYGIPTRLFRSLLAAGPAPDAILVTSMMTYWHHGVSEAIAHIREALPGIPVILGGIYATLCTDHARATSGADAVIPGHDLRDLVTAIESELGASGPGPLPAASFTDWPDPAWDLYPAPGSALILTTRGCPFRCEVCAAPRMTPVFERGDINRTVKLITTLAALGVTDAAFADDALLHDSAHHALPLFEELAAIGAPLSLHTPNGLHIRAITPEIAHAMRRAGVATIRLSLETVSAARMSTFSGKADPEAFKEALDALRSAGFPPEAIGVYLLAGLPGQSPDELAEAVAFAHHCGVRVRPALFTPVPGTPAFTAAIESGMIPPEADPVLHNNTLRTGDWWPDGVTGYNRFVADLRDAEHRRGLRGA